MKRIYKLAVLIVVLSMALAMLAALSACNNKTDKFIVYNWEEYISDDVKDGFAQYYKAKTGKDIVVEYSTFDTNEIMLTKIINGDANVDVICPSEYAIERLLRKGLLAKLDKAAMPNYSNIDPMIIDNIDANFSEVATPDGKVNMNDYFVPYMWGTLGLLYNTDKVKQEDLAQGWGLLWNKANNPTLEGKILMKDSIRDAIAATVFYLKENNRLPSGLEDKTAQELINTVDPSLLSAIETALKEQKPHLKGYEVDFGKDDMLNGLAYVDLAWSGDALWAIEEGDNLDYYVPESGSNIWFDGWVIPTASTKKDVAMLWIDYLCDPVKAMENMMEIGYTAGVSPQVFQESESALAILQDNEYDKEDFFADARRYPTDVEHLGIMKDLDEFSDQAVDMWERVKAEGHGPNVWVIVFSILGGLIIVGGAVIYFLTVKKRRRFTVSRPALAKMEISEQPLAPNAEAEQAIKEPKAEKEDWQENQPKE